MLALIEIRRRKLQFGFVTGVVALIAYLIIMVTGLGLGLNEAAGTALLNLNGDHLAYASNSNLSVIRSRLSESDVAEIQALPAADRATPVGYVAAVIEYGPEESDTAAIIGVIPGSFAEPRLSMAFLSLDPPTSSSTAPGPASRERASEIPSPCPSASKRAPSPLSESSTRATSSFSPPCTSTSPPGGT